MSRLDTYTYPLLTQDAIDRLFKRKLYTVLSFVENDPEFVARISGLQYSTVLTIRNAILTKFSSPLTTGYQVYNDILQHCALISSGILNLDDLLDGGFMTGNIYELCGKTGSGKTQMCMTISINVSEMNRNQTVLYIDTKNDLSSERIFEVIDKKASLKGKEDVGSLMNRIKICRIHQATQLISLLQQLIREFEGKTIGFRLLIIDSISSIFFRYLGQDSNRGFVLLNHLSNFLHFISVEYQIVVLVANLVTDWAVESNDSERNERIIREIETPALGKYWSQVPDTRINVKKLENSEKRLLVTMKSTSQPIGKATQIVVTDAGVH